MDDKQSIVICLQGIGIVLSLVFINDIYNERWFDVGLMLVFIAAVLIVVNKINKIK
ncbi:MAG: hypothetical protein ACI86X_002420 [Moritella sp.]|jgi:hypothetical protein